MSFKKTGKAKPNVLIVDDEEDIRNMIAFEFELKGYNVIEAADGIEAMDRLKSTPVDLVVSDVRMPRGDGKSLLTKIQAMSEQPPIVMISGYTDLAASEALNLGASRFVSKPFDIIPFVQELCEEHLDTL
jgi:DNA-binding NtrC family response regulator